MAEAKPKPGESAERTRRGFEVPVPTRGEFFSNLKKIAKKPSGLRGPKE